MLCPGSEAGIAEVSLHPVHLLDSMERALPAALIPFCSYQANMSLLGNPGDQFPFVACGKFQPYLLEGQLCYSLHLRDFVSGGSLGGKGNGLLLVIDPVIMSYENVKQPESGGEKSEGSNNPNRKTKGGENILATIYISTISPGTGSKNGSYALSVLKKMTGTTGFLEMPDDVKGCQVEIYEECNTRKYLERVGEECKCVPWGVNYTSGVEVSPHGYIVD